MKKKFQIALFSHVAFAAIFIAFIPLVYIDNDYSRGIRQFQKILSADFFTLSEGQELYSWAEHSFFRMSLFFSSLMLSFFLSSLKLIKPEALGVYFIWPYSAFLATRMKLEALAFPFCLIRTDLPIRFEIPLILSMFLLGMFSPERNFLVIGLFRVALVAYRIVNSAKWFAIATVGALVLIELGFEFLAQFSAAIRRFAFTREIVNPEYSLVESAGVFLSSYHLTINPVQGWMFHLPFGLAIALLTWRNIVKGVKLNEALPVIATYLSMTTLTHAFQKASYYFFFLPAFFRISFEKDFTKLFVVGWLHVLLSVMFYRIFVLE